MSLRFRGLDIVVDAPDRRFRFQTVLGPGLTVIRGANTIGKSLLVQSLLYGIGMDDLFATRQGTLTRALSVEIDGPGGRSSVSRSYVEVEIENSAGQIITCRRLVQDSTGPANGHQLVRVWQGAHLTEPRLESERGSESDYFVNRSGSALAAAGFHTYLAAFLGWDLPFRGQV